MTRKSGGRRPGVPIVVAVSFLLAVAALALMDRVPDWVPLRYLLVSVPRC